MRDPTRRLQWLINQGDDSARDELVSELKRRGEVRKVQELLMQSRADKLITEKIEVRRRQGADYTQFEVAFDITNDGDTEVEKITVDLGLLDATGRLQAMFSDEEELSLGQGETERVELTIVEELVPTAIQRASLAIHVFGYDAIRLPPFALDSGPDTSAMPVEHLAELRVCVSHFAVLAGPCSEYGDIPVLVTLVVQNTGHVEVAELGLDLRLQNRKGRIIEMQTLSRERRLLPGEEVAFSLEGDVELKSLAGVRAEPILRAYRRLATLALDRVPITDGGDDDEDDIF